MIWIVKCTDCQGSARFDGVQQGERLVHEHTLSPGREHAHNAQWWVEVRPEPRSGS